MPELPDIVTGFALALSVVCTIKWFRLFDEMLDMRNDIDDLKRQVDDMREGSTNE